MIGHRHRLGEPFTLVVATAQAHRVHVAPVAFGLQMFERVAVALRRGGHQIAAISYPRQLQQVPLPDRTHVEGRNRMGVVILRAGRQRGVNHTIKRPQIRQRLTNSVLHEHETRRLS